MKVQEEIRNYIVGQPEPKRSDLQQLHDIILKLEPQNKLWFDNGRNSENRTVSNPTVGYGIQVIQYANGTTREFFQIGVSANTTGISVYILGLKDKTYLARTYGKDLGKAKVTGYCIKFKTLEDINLDVLKTAIQDGFQASLQD